MNTSDLTDAQAECLMAGVQLSRNGSPWRMSDLKAELRQRGYAAEDVEVAMDFWCTEERDKLTEKELACVRRALVLSQQPVMSLSRVKVRLENEGHDQNAIEAATDICLRHEIFKEERIRPNQLIR